MSLIALGHREKKPRPIGSWADLREQLGALRRDRNLPDVILMSRAYCEALRRHSLTRAEDLGDQLAARVAGVAFEVLDGEPALRARTFQLVAVENKRVFVLTEK